MAPTLWMVISVALSERSTSGTGTAARSRTASKRASRAANVSPAPRSAVASASVRWAASNSRSADNSVGSATIRCMASMSALRTATASRPSLAN